ncbi:hypothetical protein ICN84_03630 [Akkermansia glycaniphila]|uniref:hypothetical protein n=1 Tax=Akkermansia glycaniphila TaxID=1679444 RepID=UPI001C02A0D1|nr:hypothetical protein [Akkermansia glycaniphila]MBT9449163.1 hypothetical protein [Akkermansia glycaniphila]
MNAFLPSLISCTLLACANAAPPAPPSAETLARQQADEEADREIIRQYSADQGRWLALQTDRDQPEKFRKAVLEWIDRNAAASFLDPEIMKKSFLAHADKIYTDDEIARLEATCHEFDELYEEVCAKKQAEQDARYIRQCSAEKGMTTLPNGIMYKATVSKEGENRPVFAARIAEGATTSGFVMETLYGDPAARLSQSIREILPHLPPALEWRIVVPVDLLDKATVAHIPKRVSVVVYTLKINGATPNDHLERNRQTPTAPQP